MTTRFWFAGVWVCALAVPAGAIVPTASEQALASAWAEQHLLGAQANPALALTYAGRPFAELRKAWTVKREQRELEGNRTEYTVAWSDPATKLEVRCTAIRFGDFPAVEWVVHLHNGGTEKTPIIEGIRPLDAPLLPPGSAATVHFSLGDSNSADSFAPQKKPLPIGDSAPFLLAPRGGRSSDPYMPFFNLAAPDRGVVVALGWSGQWEARFQQSEHGLCVAAGQQLTHLALLPGETIRTPRMLLGFWEGSEPLRGNNLLRALMIAHYLPRRDGRPVYPPICGCVGWTAPDGTYADPHINSAKVMGDNGVEVLWSDMDPQQWYPGGFPEGTGNWEVDKAKYPQGLKPISDAIREAGMEYLLWFEPERVHPGTKLDREHPEWIMKPQGEWSQLFRFHEPKAREWMTDLVDGFVNEAGLKWIRWDFNIEPLGFWRRNDAPDRQGMTEIGHVEGLYAMWDALRARHPGLVIDNCASGGRRIDLETCARGIPLWHSDLQCTGKPAPAADQLQNAGLFRWIPMHACGNFALEPAYEFRSVMTGGGPMAFVGPDGKISAAGPDPAETVRRTIAVEKKLRPYLLGDFYPLFPHVKNEDAWFGYQFHRAESGDGVVVVFRRAECKEPAATLRLFGIDAAAKYEVSSEDAPGQATVAGDKLQAWSVRIEAQPGATILYYRRIAD